MVDEVHVPGVGKSLYDSAISRLLLTVTLLLVSGSLPWSTTTLSHNSVRPGTKDALLRSDTVMRALQALIQENNYS